MTSLLDFPLILEFAIYSTPRTKRIQWLHMIDGSFTDIDKILRHRSPWRIQRVRRKLAAMIFLTVLISCQAEVLELVSVELSTHRT